MFLPGKFHGQRSLVGCSPWGHRVGQDWVTNTQSNKNNAVEPIVNKLWFIIVLVTQLCQTLCNPMNCSMPGFPVLHYLLEFAQTPVHWVGDAIQPSHPPLLPSPASNLSQHQGLSQWVSSSHQAAKVLELQHQSFQWIFGLISFRTDWLDLLAVQGTLKSLYNGTVSPSSWQYIKFYSKTFWFIKCLVFIKQ